MIEFSLTGIKITATAKQIEAMRSEFKNNHFVLIKHLLPKNLFSKVLKGMPPRAFKKMIHKNISVELCLKSNMAFAFLRFLTNNYAFFDLIQKITGCAPIGCFNGRVYRMSPGAHYDSWHDDWAHTRMIAMSINLSENKFQGGELSLRPKKSPEQIVSIINRGPGDAVLFQLAKNLEHRVGDVRGKYPRTAFAGWFQAKPNYITLLRNM